jgi:hypothetical protein
LYVTRHGGDVSALLTTPASFAREPLVTSLYGVPTWDGTSAPLPVPSAGRVGLLSRAALLATGLPKTRPIMKGLFIRTALLCDTVPPPPPGACMTLPPPLPAVSTTREKVEALTEQPGTVCSGCHSNSINPLGFITENFDAVGRERSEESVYDATGTLLGKKVVRTEVIPQIVPEDPRKVSGAAEATALIDESRKVHSCFSQQYFRYVTARLEDAQADGCGLSALEGAAMANKPLADVQKGVARLNEFKTRSFQ